ncbi:hypothetical protein H6F77_00295 [Microcoleus sp. FACHB-831]|uniref:hypothetical protein n=1 Tax=Microcoleus sp. FACHB-831 TaxID=2692827 RepID=UPI001688AD48|nr:hypothetical protein [Microcoleus sp. FACHB-831]MBD1919563.1 hypothetical protein [Microcoleus sp. FACHB-831]
MKIKTHLALSLLAGMGIAFSCVPQTVLAQTGDAQPLQDFQQNQQNKDPFSSSSEGESMGVFDLIHRAQLGNLRSYDEFSAEQGKNIDSAAAKFRSLQRERLRNLNQGTGVSPATPATPANSVTPAIAIPAKN